MRMTRINALSMMVCFLSLILSASASESPRYALPNLPVLESVPVTIGELEDRIPKMKKAGTAYRMINVGNHEVFQETVVGAETPHVKWAKPFINGPLKEVLFVRAAGQWIAPECRDPVEICQRLEIQYPRYAWTPNELYCDVLSHGKANSEFVTHMYQPIWDRLLLTLKSAHPQVIVLPLNRLGFPFMNPECERELARLVFEGAGLVLVAPATDWLSRKNVGKIPNEIDNGKTSVFMDTIFPLELKKNQPNVKPYLVPTGRHFITDGVAFDRFTPALFLAGNLRTGAVAIAKTEDGVPGIIISEYGKGRVVTLAWNSKDPHDWGGYIPIWDRTDLEHESPRYWEQEFACLIRAMLWAARMEPPISLQTSVSSKQLKWGENAVIDLTIDSRAQPMKLKVEATVSDREYKEEFTISGPVSVKGNESETVCLNLGMRKVLKPSDTNADHVLPIKAGEHVVDIILRDPKGSVVNFASASFKVEEPLDIALTGNPTIAREGETVAIALQTKPREGVTVQGKKLSVQWQVVDNWGRLRADVTQDANHFEKDQAIKFNHKMDHVKGNPTMVTARILVDGNVVQETSLPVYVPEFGRHGWGKDFLPTAWTRTMRYDRELFYRSMRAMGFRGIYYQVYSISKSEVDDIVWADLALQLAAAGAGGVNMSNECARNKNNQHWWYSKAEEERMKAIRKYVEPVGAIVKKTGATSLIMCDEAGLDMREGDIGEMDHSPVSIAEFRKRLQDEYKTLEALNEQWGTSYKTWDEIKPLLRSQAKGLENYGPWLDFRTFMETLYAENWWKHQQIYEELCGIPLDVGADGIYTYSHDTISVGVDFAKVAGPKTALFEGAAFNRPWIAVSQQFKIGGSFSRVYGSGAGVGCGGAEKRDYANDLYQLFNGSLGSFLYEAGTMYYTGCGALFKNGVWLKEANETMAKLSPLIIGSRRETPQVGILYTHPSYLLQEVLTRGGKGIGTKQHHQSRYALELMCWDLQTPFRYVNYLKLPGDLKDLKVLLMTGCQTLSKEQGKAIRRFVEEGGIVMADFAPGIYDLHGKPYVSGQGPVDSLFGVSREKLNVIQSSPWDNIGFNEPPKELGIPAFWWPSSIYERGLKVTDGKSLGVNYDITGLAVEQYKEGMCPAFVYKKTGKGFTLLLNFLLEHYTVQPGFKYNCGTPLTVVRSLIQQAGIQKSSVVKKGFDELEFYYVNRFYQDGGMEHCTVMQQFGRERDEHNITVDFGRKGHLYDMRKGTYLGEGERAEVNVLSGGDGAKVISLLPYKVENVMVSCPQKIRVGEVAKVECKVTSSTGPALDHCLQVEIKTPDGTKVLPYSGNFWARQGKLTLDIPFALNDPIGNWTISARDTVSGVTGKMNLKLIN